VKGNFFIKLKIVILKNNLNQMIKHIVLWAFKEQADGCAKAENIKKAKTALELLKEKIQEIQYMEIGENFDTSLDSFDLALYAEFKNRESLKVYQSHPEHLKVIDYLRKVRDKRTVVDYEI
jgi:hypothetical protein